MTAERLLNSAWHLAMLMCLFACTMVALMLAYGAMLSLFGALPLAALSRLGAALALATLTVWIARHRDELIEG
jgi:hypothetical protein